jgi:hypothetical protein
MAKNQNRVFDQLFGVSRKALTSLWHRIRSEQREISPELAMYEVNRELPVPSMHGCDCLLPQPRNLFPALIPAPDPAQAHYPVSLLAPTADVLSSVQSRKRGNAQLIVEFE